MREGRGGGGIAAGWDQASPRAPSWQCQPCALLGFAARPVPSEGSFGLAWLGEGGGSSAAACLPGWRPAPAPSPAPAQARKGREGSGREMAPFQALCCLPCLHMGCCAVQKMALLPKLGHSCKRGAACTRLDWTGQDGAGSVYVCVCVSVYVRPTLAKLAKPIPPALPKRRWAEEVSEVPQPSQGNPASRRVGVTSLLLLLREAGRERLLQA